MKKTGRYDTSGLIEAQFESGSCGRVLKNLMRIKSKREMDRIEAKEHFRTIEEIISIYDRNHRFTATDICRIHKIWLEGIYEWAGKYRQVNLTKGDFPFAHAGYIPKLMVEFEKGPLYKFTPCRFALRNEIVEAIAIVHTELYITT